MSKDNKTELWDSSIEEIQKGYIEKEEYIRLKSMVDEGKNYMGENYENK